MLTYANAFDSQFSLLLREWIYASLADMQDATFEVESNIIVAERLEGDAERRRQGESPHHPQILRLINQLGW